MCVCFVPEAKIQRDVKIILSSQSFFKKTGFIKMWDNKNSVFAYFGWDYHIPIGPGMHWMIKENENELFANDLSSNIKISNHDLLICFCC